MQGSEDGSASQKRKEIIYRLIEEAKATQELIAALNEIPQTFRDESFSAQDERKIHQLASMAEAMNEDLTGFYYEKIYGN